jgi:hypothetical protein
MIRVSASIHRYQRKTVNGSIVATLDDYDKALMCWDRVSREHVSKLNKRDRLLIQSLIDLDAKSKYVDIYMLADHLKKGYNTVYYWLKGNEKNGIGGLLDRCDNISICDQTETEYDKELTGEDVFEREKKIGGKTKRRLLMKWIGDNNPLDQSSAVVSLDGERANVRLNKILAK